MTISSSLRSYRINFCEVSEALPNLCGETWVITDENVSSHYAAQLADCKHVLSVKPGEASKSMDTYEKCLSWLAKTGAKRGSMIVAFGGGVIGDLAGFVAATYMRGVQFTMVPTSLLAMVDSSVGGKVGIDLEAGKNLVGCFWPPVEVCVATGFLETLPEREFRCGASEVWKYGAIMDSDLFETLESAPLKRDGRLDTIVRRCISHKAAIVQEDEHETMGLRAILNFGHTVGHALETSLGYGEWTHGEAISVGMVVEAHLGELLGLTRPGTSDRLAHGLSIQGLPTDLPTSIDPETMIDLMKKDKKATAEGMSFSLLTHVGECKLVHGVPEPLVRQVLSRA